MSGMRTVTLFWIEAETPLLYWPDSSFIFSLQNRSVAGETGRHLWRSSCLTFLLKQDQLEQVAQSSVLSVCLPLVVFFFYVKLEFPGFHLLSYGFLFFQCASLRKVLLTHLCSFPSFICSWC